VFQVLNPFLDKYRLINEDYRISPISGTRNFYLAVCHTSPWTPEERPLTPTELFSRLSTPRTFFRELGHGAANILRTNSYELLGPRSQLSSTIQTFFDTFVQENYEMPLSYALILESLANLQRTLDYRLAIIHAETGYEVHVVDRLLKLMIDEGMTRSDAVSAIEADRAFWGVKNKIRQLDSRIQSYCSRKGLTFQSFFRISVVFALGKRFVQTQKRCGTRWCKCVHVRPGPYGNRNSEGMYCRDRIAGTDIGR